MRSKYLQATFYVVMAAPAVALDLGVGSNGVAGLTVLPMATIPTGSLVYQYQNRVMDADRQEGLNHSLAVGLTSFAELGLRTADTSIKRNGYDGGGGIRDLSASAKLQFNNVLGLKDSPWKLAAGVTDYGGAATLFRSTYGVLTYDQRDWASSLGYAKAQKNLNNPIHGVFGSAAFQATPWLRLRVESNQERSWAGLTLSNESWLAKINAPVGASVFLNVDQQVRGLATAEGRKPWLGVGVNLPLDWSMGRQSPPSRQAQAASMPQQQAFQAMPTAPAVASAETMSAEKVLEQSPVATVAPQLSDAASSPAPTTDSRHAAMDRLSQALAEHGFEGIDVGQSGNTLVVKVSDFVYEHSLLDGAGVALGLLSQLAGEFDNYRLVQARWGTPSVGFNGQLACLAQWLKALPCPADEAVQPVFRDLDEALVGVDWRVRDHAPYRYKLRVKLNPIYNYYWATEYSLLDYSVGLNINPFIHLWDGGALEFSRSAHMTSSKEFQPGGNLSYSRIPDTNRRVLLHHMQKLNHGLSLRMSVGELMQGNVRGGQTEARWDSLNGEWATGLNLSHWQAPKNSTYLPTGGTKLAFARYAPTGTDWSLEVSGGEYWFKDKGFSATSSHWFGDTKFSYFVRHSVPPERFWPGKQSITVAGMELTFPLTPRRAMNADSGWQIKGTPRLGLSLLSPINRETENWLAYSNGAPIYQKAWVEPAIPNYASAVLLDSDRANASYFSGKLERLRYAYQRWVMKTTQ
ncbi:hypothetical protein B9Z51_06470 [Limnohabitans sp. T6-5]|uniref:YjbH domain-containing protein n=1 Tax=Limnohabitans sp. T6-5 TaxID=1100724 RepID=UPI000D3C5996|nr:YjbH domain-containing protein [Limnohabitans sp. T6-5]PUE08595.1 hypothetical protein B9Z51_06470 [Limnohabitans sp. T6-5]